MPCSFAIVGLNLGALASESHWLPPSSAECSVPRFHFNVFDGVSDIDTEGTELPSWEEARFEAIRLAGEIIRDDSKRIAVGEDWRLEVTDETGLILFRLDFNVMEAPALSGKRT